MSQLRIRGIVVSGADIPALEADPRSLDAYLGVAKAASVLIARAAALLIAGAATLVPHSAAAQERAPRVLLVGIDGVRPDILAEVETPHIDALIAEGAYSARANTTRPTVSGPAWSSMLTGVWPEKHGVRSNDFTGNRYAEYPDFLTRIERGRPELETFVAADWLPLVTDDSGGPLIAGPIDRMVFHDGYEVGWAEGDELGVQAAVEALSMSGPDAMFVYLGNPDETSHRTGAIGPEYREAIALADRQVGRLVDAVRSRDGYENDNWLILISTDHGRRPDGGHGGNSSEETTIFFLAHGPSVRPGTLPGEPQIVDVAVTALAHLGIAIDPAWGLDGEAVGLRP